MHAHSSFPGSAPGYAPPSAVGALISQCSKRALLLAAGGVFVLAPSAGAAQLAPSPTSPQEADEAFELFVDEEYSLLAPKALEYVPPDLPKGPIVGPTPERSPLRVRFTARDGGNVTLSVVVRKAQSLKQSLFTVRTLSGVHISRRPPDC